jgi:hypothetical protein
MMWNAISFPAAALAIPQGLAEDEWGVLFVLLFPLIGIAVLWARDRDDRRAAAARRRGGALAQDEQTTEIDMTQQIQDAYIVAAVRTPVGKAPRGMFRNVRPDDMLAHVLKGALAQVPGLDPHEIGDVIVGCAMPEGAQGMNVARIGVLLAGLPTACRR